MFRQRARGTRLELVGRMRGYLTIVTIIPCFLLLEPAVVADPPDGAQLSEPRARGAEQVATRARAIQLTTRAIATAQAGDCPAAIRLGLEVRDLDRAYYDQAFVRDPAIGACTGGPPSSDPPIAATERQGFVFGAGLAFGGRGSGPAFRKRGVAQVELRVGWMVRPQLAMFATVLGAVLLPDGDWYRLVGLGARAGTERLFVDLRAGALSMPAGSDLDNPRVTSSRFGWSAGLGLELVHFPGFGIELRGDVLGTTSDTLFLAGLGFGFYP